MKTVIKTMILALTVTAVFFAYTLFSFADEVTEPLMTETNADEENPTSDGIDTVDYGTDTQTEREKFVFTDFFQDKILPLLTNATVLSLVTAALTLFAQRSRKGLLLENSELRGAYNKQLQIYETLKEQLPMELNEFTEKMRSELKKTVIDEVKLDPQAYATLAALVEVVNAKLDAITRGALVAWGNSPAAREALDANATQSALVEAQARCKQYEDYIREMKGAEAEEIIAGVREA